MLSKLGAGVGLLALAAFFGWLYGNARYAAGLAVGTTSVASQVNAAAESVRVSAELAYAKGIAENQAREVAHIEWRDRWFTPAKEIIIKRITEYAQTPTGAAVCLDADGLRAANQDIDAANLLATPATTSRSAGILSATPTDQREPGRNRNSSPSAPMDSAISPRQIGVREETRLGRRELAEVMVGTGPQLDYHDIHYPGLEPRFFKVELSVCNTVRKAWQRDRLSRIGP
jgi:hypothetical protein